MTGLTRLFFPQNATHVRSRSRICGTTSILSAWALATGQFHTAVESLTGSQGNYHVSGPIRWKSCEGGTSRSTNHPRVLCLALSVQEAHALVRTAVHQHEHP